MKEQSRRKGRRKGERGGRREWGGKGGKEGEGGEKDYKSPYCNVLERDN